MYVYMHIYSFSYLFKHAVIISDYMASNDTMNDEQLEAMLQPK